MASLFPLYSNARVWWVNLTCYLLKLEKLVVISSNFWVSDTSSSLSLLKQRGDVLSFVSWKMRSEGWVFFSHTTFQGGSWHPQCLQTPWRIKNTMTQKQVDPLKKCTSISQYKCFVPNWVESLLLDVGLMDLIVRHGVLDHVFNGLGSGTTCAPFFFVLQYGQQAVGVT